MIVCYKFVHNFIFAAITDENISSITKHQSSIDVVHQIYNVICKYITIKYNAMLLTQKSLQM